MDPDLVIFGALHRDLVGVLKTAHQTEASNPVTFSLRTGGVGANVARAIIHSRQVETVCLVAPVGADGLEPELAVVGFEGVDVCPVSVPGASAGRYVAIVDERGELVSGYSDTTACESVDHVSLLNLCPPAARTVVLDANLSEATLSGLVTALPVQRIALAVSPFKARRLLPIAAQINTLFCNRREAAALTDLPIDSTSKALSEALVTVGFAGHVLTDGSAPITVCENDTTSVIDVPFAASPSAGGNTNGAGDALAGATIGACHAGTTLRDSVSTSGLAAAAQALTQA